MMYFSRVFFVAATLTVFFTLSNGEAYYVWSPAEGKFISPEDQIRETPEQQYNEALRLREEGKTDQMIRRLKELVRTYPLSSQAPEAQYLIATTVEEEGKPERAARELQKLIHDFPQSNRVDQAVERLYRIGTFFLTGQKQKVLGVPLLPTLPKAVEVFQFIVEHAPYGASGDQAQFQLGVAHRKMGHYSEAVSAFQKLIDDYPDSNLSDDAHYQLAEASFELSQVANRDQQSVSSAADHLQQFIQQYRTGTLTERAQILKRQLEEQDAEKNYRIGLYYEKEGFIESALIYYEDVANRYAETPFGQKAAERYQALAEPARTISRDKIAIEKRLAEVESLLAALRGEEKRKDLPPDRLSEVAAMRTELETERTSLELSQKQFEKETKEKFTDRKKSLRARERNLREKFKIFGKRKKAFRNPSPELVEVFDEWHQSLLKEQAELNEERARLGAGATQFKTEGWSFGSLVPHFGRPPSADRLIRFKEKKWAELDSTFQRLTAERKAQEEKMAQLQAERIRFDEAEFRLARATDTFNQRLPMDLAAELKAVETHREALIQKNQAFDEARKQFVGRYGLNAFNALSIAAESGLDISSIHHSSELEQTLEDLQSQKKSLSEAWLLQKEKVDAMAKVLGLATVSHPVGTAGQDSQGDPGKEARVLKKRMKYLEREIRRRLDQIQDWESENAVRMQKLDELLHPKSERSAAGKAANAVAGPATGFYRLAKIFLFGLPNEHQKLNQEAMDVLHSGEGNQSPQDLEAIRELREEVELQSILIQGRAREVTEMKADLDQLWNESRKFPDFEYQSMLVDRFPTALEHSVTSASALFEGEESQAVFRERYGREHQKFNEIETRLKQMDQKIVPVSEALVALKQEEADREAALQKEIKQDVSRVEGAESRSSRSQADSKTTPDERPQLEAELVRMKTEINAEEKALAERKEKLEQALFDWYKSDASVRSEIQSAFGEEGKNILAQSAEWLARESELQTLFEKAVREEKTQAELVGLFLDQKSETLEKRRERLKRSSVDLEPALDREIKRTAELKNQISAHISYLSSSFKK